MSEAQVRKSDATVSLQDFRDAFSQQWRDDLQDRDKELRRTYRGSKTTLTAYMLGKKDDFCHAFFARVARKLDQKPLRERQNLDMVYYTEKARNISHTKRIRPARMNVIIEHEAKKTGEEEMWKMLMWRASLKVLVFYDWSDDEKEGNRRRHRKEWLENKRNDLFDMHSQIDALWSEDAKTDYLFLVGRSRKHGELPLWWHADSSNHTLRPLRQRTRKS